SGACCVPAVRTTATGEPRHRLPPHQTARPTMAKTTSGLLYCFSHVQKAGGTTVEAVMRRNLGIRHMVVDPRLGWIYRETDLRADLRLNPLARNLCSHWLRPFVRFGDLEERM